MGDTVKVGVNEVVVSATVVVTDYGYRLRISAEDRFTLGTTEGDEVRLQIGRVVGRYRWTSTLPYGGEVLIALRRMELDRPKKRRTAGNAYYGGRYADPSAPKAD